MNPDKDLDANLEMNMIDDETDEEVEGEMEGWDDREFVSDVSEDEDDGCSDLEDVVSPTKIGPLNYGWRSTADDYHRATIWRTTHQATMVRILIPKYRLVNENKGRDH